MKRALHNKKIVYLPPEWLPVGRLHTQHRTDAEQETTDQATTRDVVRRMLILLAGNETNFEAALAVVEQDFKATAERQNKQRSTVQANGKRVLERIRNKLSALGVNDREGFLALLQKSDLAQQQTA